MKRPRLNVLRTFEAAGRLLSFSRAAEELNITQAAVSQQMRDLEAFLDAELFNRSYRQLSLTYIGQSYLDEVHEALDRLDTITDQLFPRRSDKLVTLKCTSSVATLWLAPRMGKFHKANPDIDLRIRTMDRELDNIHVPGSTREMVVLSENAQASGAEKLLDITITPVCSPKLIKKRGRPNNPADLLNYELLHVVGYRDGWHRWFRSFLGEETSVPGGLSVDSSMFALEAALRGDGIMLGRRPFIDKHLGSGKLVEVFEEPFQLHTSYYMHRDAASGNSAAITRVMNWLVSLAEKKSSVSEKAGLVAK